MFPSSTSKLDPVDHVYYGLREEVFEPFAVFILERRVRASRVRIQENNALVRARALKLDPLEKTILFLFDRIIQVYYCLRKSLCDISSRKKLIADLKNALSLKYVDDIHLFHGIIPDASLLTPISEDNIAGFDFPSLNEYIAKRFFEFETVTKEKEVQVVPAGVGFEPPQAEFQGDDYQVYMVLRSFQLIISWVS
jgi:hypothetical protein